MPIDGIFGTTIELLGKTLDLRARSQGMISANIANAETPGYTPKELSFEGELKSALKRKGETAAGSVEVANPRFIPLKGGSADILSVTGDVVEDPSRSPGPDGNGVELETEMGRMAENQIMYNASVQLLNMQFGMLQKAIKGN